VEACPATGSTPFRAFLKCPGVGAHFGQYRQLVTQPVITAIIEAARPQIVGTERKLPHRACTPFDVAVSVIRAFMRRDTVRIGFETSERSDGSLALCSVFGYDTQAYRVYPTCM
jgi:hypothetical protein